MAPPHVGTTGNGDETEEPRRDETPSPVIERVYIQRDVKVRTFLGDHSLDRVQGFEEDVRRAWKSIPKEDEVRRLDVILDHIGPSVALELSCQDPASQKDPEELIKLILKIYGESRSPHQLLKVLLDIHQQSDDVRTFSQLLKQSYDQLVRRQAQLKLSTEPDKTLREQFVLGIRDLDLKRRLKEKVRQDSNVSFLTLRDLALDYIEDTEGVSVSSAPVVAAPDLSKISEQLQQLMTQNEQLMTQNEELRKRVANIEENQTSASKSHHQTGSQGSHNKKRLQNFKKSMTCYGCGERGHFRRECPKGRPQY